MTSLLLRADSGPSIGVGHVMRCLAFAEEAVHRGWQVRFSGVVTGWARAAFEDLGVAVESGADLAADLVVVDHYDLGAVSVDGVLVSMEDGPFGRRRADVVVDCGLAAVERPPDGSGVTLLGPRYAPLRKAVIGARARRRSRGEVVVVLGATAPEGPLRVLLRAAAATGMKVRAITSADIEVPGVLVEGPRTDLPDVLAGAELVVSAAGVTLLELCCIGVPMALVLLADNQAMGYRAAIERGAAVGLGVATALDQAKLTRTLAGLLADDARRAELATAASGLVDGRGAARVLDAAIG